MRYRSMTFCTFFSLTMMSCQKASPPSTRIVYSGIHGVIQDFSPDRQEVTIQHDAIPGYMASMTMPFHVVSPRLLDGFFQHQPVQFQLVITPKDAMIDAIVAQSTGTQASDPDASPKPADNAELIHIPEVGEALPDITLTNQEGKRVRLRNYRGKVLAINFIYTQCPLPTYCPLSMATFAAVQNKLKGNPANPFALFTLTFDPRHDTPEKMKAYGHTYGADPTYWQLLTGHPQEVRKAVSLFDVNYWTSKTGAITEHTLSTVIVDPQGRIAHLYTGPNVKADEVIQDIQDLLNKKD